jgi:hypothetical protein
MLENTARGARNTADDPAEPLPLMTRARSNQSSPEHRRKLQARALLPRTSCSTLSGKNPAARSSQNHKGGADIKALNLNARGT